jgi:putative membrane protein
MKKQMIDLLKGILVGIGNIAPGLSGGVIAVVLNVYDRLINALNEIYKRPFKVIKEMWGLMIGIVIGAGISFFGILTLIEKFPIPTMMLFIGFILGPVPKIFESVKAEKKKIVDYLAFFGVIAFIVGLSLFNGNAGSYTSINSVALFFIGVVAASTMIIPGVSGTAILMILGVFTYLVTTINGFVDAALSFNISKVLELMGPLIPFGFGVLIGLILLAKLVSKLFEKHKRTMNFAIIGLLISCPFSIISTMLTDYKSQMQVNIVLNLIIGVVTLIIGSSISVYMSGIEKKNEQVQDI